MLQAEINQNQWGHPLADPRQARKRFHGGFSLEYRPSNFLGFRSPVEFYSELLLNMELAKTATKCGWFLNPPTL
jgi:hypothetical protein